MKTKKTFLTLFVLMFALVTTTAFTTMTESSSKDHQSCTLVVKNSDGTPTRDKNVRIEVSGGISCSGGRDFETNKNGEVTIKWSKGCYLRKVYIKKNYYDVDFKDGGSYTLRLKN